MKKNLASFGTALSRDEAKKVIGGRVLVEDGDGTVCNTEACKYLASPNSTLEIDGKCGPMGGMRTDCGCDGKVAQSGCNKS